MARFSPAAWVSRYGGPMAAGYATHAELRWWVSPCGSAALPFAGSGQWRVAAGLPLGPIGRRAEFARAFALDTAQLGMRTVFFGVEEGLASRLREDGFGLLPLGSQPLFRLDGPQAWMPRRGVRAQVSRARNHGVTVALREPGVPLPLDALMRCQRHWLAGKRWPVLGFLTHPRLDHLGSADRVAIAMRGGEVVGFAVAVPAPGAAAWQIEQVVRLPGAPNGTAESLVVALMEAARGRVAEVSLGLAPLARSGSAGLQAPLWFRAAAGLARRQRGYSFAGLERFKAKFHPTRWEAVHLAALERPSPAHLAAAFRAFSGMSPFRFAWRAWGPGKRFLPDPGNAPPHPAFGSGRR